MLLRASPVTFNRTGTEVCHQAEQRKLVNDVMTLPSFFFFSFSDRPTTFGLGTATMTHKPLVVWLNAPESRRNLVTYYTKSLFHQSLKTVSQLLKLLVV